MNKKNGISLKGIQVITGHINVLMPISDSLFLKGPSVGTATMGSYLRWSNPFIKA